MTDAASGHDEAPGAEAIRTTAEALEDEVLPAVRARVAMAEGDAENCAECAPLPAAIARRRPEEKSPAEWAYERVILYIRKFEEGLDADQEVGMGFAGSDAGTLHVQGVGFFAPDIVTFYGVDPTGAKTQLVQHVTQLNLMLKAAPKRRETANRIGFALIEQLQAEEQA